MHANSINQDALTQFIAIVFDKIVMYRPMEL